MTPADKIKLTVLKSLNLSGIINEETPYPEDTDEYYEALCEFRSGEFVTNIDSPYSRHYESKSVAAKMFDGTWVGWTYWYGGGKHGEPDSIPWMKDAYELTCEEKQEMVTVRNWSKMDG